MKVSIITSCFNREKTIRDAIESVLSQDYNNIEFIIVDGASKDSSIDIINEYKDRISIIICEPDKGMYEALNKGLRAATGDIIGLLHSDDFFYDNSVVSCIASTFKEKKPDILYGNGIFVNCNNTNKVVRNWISGKYTKSKVSRGWLPLHPTVYITKSWLKECGHYNENYKIAADSDWLIRSLYKMTPNVIYLDKYIVKMRMGGLSTKPSLVKKKWSEDMALYKQHGLNPYITLTKKILSKIPQFV